MMLAELKAIIMMMAKKQQQQGGGVTSRRCRIDDGAGTAGQGPTPATEEKENELAGEQQ